MTDELIERIASVTGLDAPIIKTVLWALRPGDIIGHCEGVVTSFDLWDREKRQAAEEMRERCIEIVRFEMLAGSIKDRTLERLRALSVEPNNE